MQKRTRRILSFMIALMFMFSSCATHKKIVDDEMTTEIGNSADGESDLSGGDDLSLDSDDSSGSSDTAQNTEDGGDLSLDEGNGSQAAADETSALEQELNQVAAESVNKPQPVESNPAPEMIQESSPMDQPVEIAQATPNQTEPETPPPAIAEAPVENPTPAEAVAETPAPVVENPVATTPPAPAVELAQIKNLEFKSNENGGVFLITADQPLTYKTRINSETNQVIIEVENATVPAKLKRPLLTKDMNSSIGSIDIYQKAKSNVARFVLQMRNQAKEPLIQPEGNSIVVLGAPIRDVPAQSSSSSIAANEAGLSGGSEESTSSASSGSVVTATGSSVAGTPVGEDIPVNDDLSKLGILNTRDLDEYIANNNKFYGKKISIEANEIDIKYILNLISEESGINLILDADVMGRVSVKLRKVPWDQALVLVLKSAKLTYRRQGTVLRILTAQSLLQEDQVAINLKNSKEQSEPLIVKNFAINYADIGDLERKIREYLADANQIERESAGQSGRSSASITQLGKVVSDSRTGMLIVTATESKLKQVESLIQVLDIQPQQVMVEARVVEAGESFNKTMGTNWGLNRGVAFDGSPRVSTSIGNPWADPQPVNISPALSYSNPQSQSGSFASSLWLGKLGVLGDLDANLRFEESEDKIKILSSPRVTVVSNTEATINQSFKLKIGTTSTVTPTGTTFTDSFSDVGVRLSVTPQISNIGTVRMRLNVSRTGAQPGNTSTNSRDMRTEVIVKSGQTIVIGGVFQSDVLKSKNGIPGLQDLPILGTLFKGQSEQSSKTELMVFVTPKILAPVIPVKMGATETEPRSSNE